MPRRFTCSFILIVDIGVIDDGWKLEYDRTISGRLKTSLGQLDDLAIPNVSAVASAH